MIQDLLPEDYQIQSRIKDFGLSVFARIAGIRIFSLRLIRSLGRLVLMPNTARYAFTGWPAGATKSQRAC
ncbi:MAG TPA: hypothetical protein VF089_04565 [Candidatus Binatia bacterium]